jgi:hypothetical protein
MQYTQETHMSNNTPPPQNRIEQVFPRLATTYKPFREFTIGTVTGVLLSCILASLFILLSDVIPGLDIMTPINWCRTNLQYSTIPFAASLLLFIISLRHLDKCLANPQIKPYQVAHADHLINIWINCFFGIGVIWTAIGMRSALLSGLAGLDAATAQELGAFTILQRLVDGGILIALSTTIFGGFGGYIMRIIKAVYTNSSLNSYYDSLEDKQRDELLAVLKRIELNTLLQIPEPQEEVKL